MREPCFSGRVSNERGKAARKLESSRISSRGFYDRKYSLAATPFAFAAKPAGARNPASDAGRVKSPKEPIQENFAIFRIKNPSLTFRIFNFHKNLTLKRSWKHSLKVFWANIAKQNITPRHTPPASLFYEPADWWPRRLVYKTCKLPKIASSSSRSRIGWKEKSSGKSCMWREIDCSKTIWQVG